MIYLIDDDIIMAECLEGSLKREFPNLKIKKFNNAISAMAELDTDERDSNLPSLILLDIMLIGPDGFTFVNELVSYPETQKIPIIVVSSLELKKFNLDAYNIVETLDKSSFTRDDLIKSVRPYVS